jgi:predicted nucleotidyltransferase component of viral defense system
MKEIINVPASVSARLQNLARVQKKPFQEILQYYGIERFLFRLSQTTHGQMFVLKGGLVFYALGIALRRPTRDIDFRGFTSNSADHIIKIIKDVCSVSNLSDGIIYKEDTIRFEETMVDADYQGIRVTFEALLGTSKIPIRIDIGFSDVITPEAQSLQYPVLLNGMEPPVLRSYPPESIVSEKFQAMVQLMDLNSRLKDFYDIWMLSEINHFTGNLLQSALIATFNQRETPIPSAIPLALKDDFAQSRQRQWETFLARNKLFQKNIENFIDVINRLRIFLLPPVQAITENVSFEKNWTAGSNWH